MFKHCSETIKKGSTPSQWLLATANACKRSPVLMRQSQVWVPRSSATSSSTRQFSAAGHWNILTTFTSLKQSKAACASLVSQPVSTASQLHVCQLLSLCLTAYASVSDAAGDCGCSSFRVAELLSKAAAGDIGKEKEEEQRRRRRATEEGEEAKDAEEQQRRSRGERRGSRIGEGAEEEKQQQLVTVTRKR
eukprot:1137465-Pelagomonas_calceolata.AAC.2